MQTHLIRRVALIILICQACQGSPPQKNSKKPFCLSDSLAKDLKLAQAQLRTVENELSMQGKITFDEDKVAKVYPLVGGFVEHLYVNLGDYVHKGQALAVIRSPEIAGIASQNSAAQSNYILAERNYQVAQELYRTGNMSEIELITAKKELENTAAELKRSREVLSIYNVGKASYYTVRAPASGYILNKDIALNMELRTEDVKPIFVISNMDYVWVMVNIYESDIDKVREGYEAEVTTISYPDKVFKGTIDKIFNVIDPDTKVLKARVILSNQDFKLKAEMFANVSVRYADREQKITIPSSAVIFDKNRYFVMVYHDRCKIETREVQIYKSNSHFAYLNSGLEANEQIITKHQLLVYDALND